MKPVINFLSTLIIIVSLSSCQKEVITGASKITGERLLQVKTYTEDIITSGERLVTTFRLSYDAEGRMTSLVSITNPGDKFLFKYTIDSYSTELYNSDAITMLQTTFVSHHLLIDSTVQHNGNTEALTEKYVYNSHKQLIKRHQYVYKKGTGTSLYNTHNYTYNEYGNVIKDEDISSVTKYDYYDDLKCNISIAPAYLQKPENLVKTTTYISGGVSEVFNHTYTFDNEKRVSAEKVTKERSSDVLIKKYTY